MNISEMQFYKAGDQIEYAALRMSNVSETDKMWRTEETSTCCNYVFDSSWIAHSADVA